MNSSKGEQIYTVVGTSSDVGKAVAARLLASGHRVRSVTRSAGVPLDDPSALARAFEGAAGAFVMIPFDQRAEDVHAREREVGGRLALTLHAAGVPRVVLLSGLNAHLRRGTSLGAAWMEEHLEDMGVAEAVSLRAGWFMENFTRGLGFVAQASTGRFATPFRADRPMPMVSAGDVGHLAAEMLLEEVPPTAKVRELHGGGDYTMAQATAILGRAIGKPTLEYVQVSAQDAGDSMVASGMSRSFADAVLETAQSFNAEEPWALEPRSLRSSSPTSLERWAADTLGVGQ
jgi:uncharacterized protein YbjT (DUF2867 family)